MIPRNIPLNYVPFPGSDRPLLVEARHIGPMDPEESVEVRIYLKNPASETREKRLAKAKSPQEVPRLSREDYIASHSAKEEDIESFNAFARDHGLGIVDVDRPNRKIVLRGTAAAISHAFRTELQMYEHQGKRIHARTGPIYLPASLAEKTESILGITVFCFELPTWQTNVGMPQPPANGDKPKEGKQPLGRSPSNHTYPPGDNFNGHSSPPPHTGGNGGSNGPHPPGHQKPQQRFPIWSRILIAFLTFLIIIGGGAFAYYQVNCAHSINDITGQAAIRKDTTARINADPLTQRTNIILLGSDTDGKGNNSHAGRPLAQTVIIVTVDPTTNYVGMLSIPRDMQMTDPAYQYEYPGGKIDEIFQQAWRGNTEQEKAKAAAGHIMDVIQANYGIIINHYAWVGLQGFIKVIDDLGGVDIDATHPMTDDDYPYDTGTGASNKYGDQRLYIPPGPQHMNGQLALEYVRTRHSDLGGDFGRTDRQQQLLSQIKVKMTQTDTISKAPELLQSLDGYLTTDLTLSQLASLAQVAKNVDVNKVQRVSFGSSQYATQIVNGRGNYSPVCSVVEQTIQHMFDVTPHCIPQGNTVGQANTTNQVTTIPSTHASTGIPTQKTTLLTAQSSNIVSTANPTTSVHNLLDLMLFTISGSLTAIQ